MLKIIENDPSEDETPSKPQSRESFFDESTLDLTMGEIAKQIAGVWDSEGTFKRLQEQRKDAPQYRIFDGPPFATGIPHYGHFLPMTIKDWAFRYQSMKGKKATMKGGWDTHGVPVETLVQKEMDIKTTQDIESLGVGAFSEACRATVLRYVNEWNHTQKIMGRWIDMESPYATMDAEYIESVWWIFSQLFEKGMVYEGKKIVAYSPALGTPLSNFEADQNYRDIEDPAVTVAFEMEDGSKLLAWTTTPWSLFGNLALAVGENIEYVKIEMNGETFILAKERLSVIGDQPYTIKATIKGKDLVGLSYDPPFSHFQGKNETQNAFKIVASDHVTLDAGTGIVHIAPAYGEEDFDLGQRNDLALIDPIDNGGKFTEEVPQLTGKGFREANPKILEMLNEAGILFASEKITHSYPHCYRTDQPLMYKAVPSWFIKVTDIKDRMVELNNEVNWMPSHLQQGRFGDWLKNARDWSVSRNRYWGAPLPIWKCEETGEVVVVGSREELFDLSGERPDDLHKAVVDNITFEKDGKTFTRIPEIFDCWFESGAMPYASEHYPFEGQEEGNPPIPADFIAEGLDQTRGWFYTLMVLSTALYDKPAFKNVVVNGMVLAENDEGKWVKMSKKLRNYPDPNDLLQRIGGDAMRFFILSSGAAKAEPLKFSDEGLDQVVKKVLLPLWNIYKFFITYANADGWKPDSKLRDNIQTGRYEEPSKNLLDQWALARLEKSHDEITAAYDINDLPRATREIAKFITDISNWFVRLSRDRFWKTTNDIDKENAYATLYEILIRYSQMIAPICPFISESIYRELTKESSVHHSLWPNGNAQNQNPQLLEAMEEVRQVVSMGLNLRTKNGMRVRQPLSEIAIMQKPGTKMQEYADLIATELNVKEVRFIEQGDPTAFKPVVNLNRAQLGKKLRAGLKDVIEKLKNEEYRLENGILQIGEHQLSVAEGDFTIEYEAIGSKVVGSENGYTVVLDLELTENLKMEGIARDLIRVIQSERKNQDLHITDRINVAITSPDQDIAETINNFRDMIRTAVLAEDISFSQSPEINELQLRVDRITADIIK